MVFIYFKESLISKTTTSGSVREKDFGEVKTVSQIQKELKRQFSAKVDVKEKPIDKRRHSLDSARPAFTSVSSSKEMPDIPDFLLQSSDKGLTSEQTVSWKRAVESWLSRPHPLGGTEGDFQKMITQSSSSVPAYVPKPRVPASAASLNLPVQDVHVRSSGSNEQQRVFSGKQDVNLRTSVNAEQHREFSGQQDLPIRSTSTEQQKVVSGQQDSHARYSGNTEQQRVFLGKNADVLLWQLKQGNVAKQDSTPAVPPLVVRKVEHRQDPRLKMRRSLDEELFTGSTSSSIPNTNNGMPYNAKESLQAQGVKLNTTSVPSMTVTTSSTTTTTQQPKYQVNSEFLKELLDKMKLQKPEKTTYQVTVVDDIRRYLDMMKNQEGLQRSKPESQDAKIVAKATKTDVELVTTSDEKSVKRSSSSVSATQEKGKRFKMDQVNPVKEKVPIATAVLPTPPSGERTMNSSSESRKEEKQTPARRPEKKVMKVSQEKEPKQHKDSPKSQAATASTKPVEQTAVPELSEAPPPAISSLDTLTSPQSTSDKLPKAPKLKLILKKRDSKEVSAQPSSDDNSELPGNKLAKEPKETEHEEKADLRAERKSLDSPVSMDLSPQCTTPTGSASPITVVSSKGRYHSQVTPTTTPTTAPTAPVSSAFPFNPPLPQGPYRSPISTGPCTSLPRPPQPPLHPVLFPPPFPPAPTSGTSAPPVLHSPSVSSAPPGGSLPFGSPPPTSSTFALHSPITPVPPMTPSATSVPSGPLPSSSSFPPLPPAPPGLQHHDQQWAAPLPHNQRFGFPTNMPPLPGIVPLSPSDVPQWAANSSLSRPVLPPPGLPPTGGRPHHVFPQSAPFPRPVPEMPVVQPQGVGFPPIGVPRFNGLPMPPTPPRLPHLGGVPAAPQMMPVRPMYGIMPSSLQFPPPPPPPAPIGYWVAPIKTTPVPSGKPKGYADVIPSQSTEQKYSKESTSSTSKKNEDSERDESRKEDKRDLGVAKVQKDDKETNKETGSECSKGEASVKTMVDLEKSSAQTGDQTNATTSKSEMADADSPKEDKGLTAGNSDKNATPNKENVTDTEAIKEAVCEVKLTSRKAEEAGAKDSEIPLLDQMSVNEPKESPMQIASTHDSTCSEENPNLGETERKAFNDDSTKHKDEDVVKNDGVDYVSRKTSTEVKDPCLADVEGSQISSSQHTTEPSGNFIDKHSDVSIAGNSVDFVDINTSFCLPTTTYQTEAERKGSKAVSKIYDILRRNAQESRSEAEEEAEEADDPDKPDDPDPDKPDNPDPSAMDDKLNTDEEGGDRMRLKSQTGRKTNELEYSVVLHQASCVKFRRNVNLGSLQFSCSTYLH